MHLEGSWILWHLIISVRQLVAAELIEPMKTEGEQADEYLKRSIVTFLPVLALMKSSKENEDSKAANVTIKSIITQLQKLQKGNRT